MTQAEIDQKSTREKILDVTIDLIEKVGTAKATTRTIAAAAGVNIAAINYHFGSKEKLVDEALSTSWEHASKHIKGYLSAEPWEPEGALMAIGEYFLEGGYRYPTITRANFFESDGQPRKAVAASIAALTGELEDRMSGSLDKTSTKELRIRLSAFVSAILFPPLVDSSCLPWLKDKSSRKEYVRILVRDLFASGR
jgi:AcrR family transcriptional regulator